MAVQFAIHRRIDASVQTVWDVVSDHAGYRGWTPLTSSELTIEGSPDHNGVGAVRKLGSWPKYSFERVVAFDAPNHLAYVLESGLPVREYRADVDLRPTTDGQGTILLYSARWESTPPGLGLAMQVLMRSILSGFAVLMDREAVKRSTR